MTQWAKDPDNMKAYAEIMKREGLSYDPFHPGVAEDQFAFADMSMLPGGPLSMDKVFISYDLRSKLGLTVDRPGAWDGLALSILWSPSSRCIKRCILWGCAHL